VIYTITMNGEFPSTSFDIQIAQSIQEIEREVWDQLSKDQPFTSYQWYRFSESVLVNEKPMYIILTLNKKPVAGAALRVTREEPVPANSRLVQYLIATALHYWPFLLCQVPFVGKTGLILPNPPLRDAALEAIAKSAQHQAQLHQASFLGFTFLNEDVAKSPGWPSDFAAIEFPVPTTRLDIKWSNFDEYINHLPRKRRKHYRQNLKRTTEMNVEISIQPTVTDIDEAMVLIKNVQEKHSDTTPWNRQLLENASMVDSVWIEAKVEDKLVGCELVVGDRGHWCVLTLGRDYDFDYVYFFLGYADIRFAIENGAQALYWGECSYDTKRRFGFQIGTNNYVTFIGNGPILHKLGTWIGKMEEREAINYT
jgi:predicted N-acyltransferase